MCPQFRKGDCQPFTLQKLTTGYKPITSSLQAAGLVIPRKACYKGFVKHYEGASFVTKLVTKLVMHYEYFARNEARYEARNASVYGGALPEGWGVTEAEMAAVIRALQIALERDEEEGPGRRVMICTDSQATMRAMETAWRKGRHTGERVDRKGLVTTMVDLRREISREREGGQTRGCVRMVYTPGHRGIAPNAVADGMRLQRRT
jgi:ribonuclease HI